MSYQLTFLPEACRELDEAFDWYETQRRGLGREFMQYLENTLGGIVENPLANPIVHRDVRRAMVKRFPYGVYYFLSAERIVVIAVFHSNRNPSHWRRRL